jgi:hypothetical protein
MLSISNYTGRHTGMDCRYPEAMEATVGIHFLVIQRSWPGFATPDGTFEQHIDKENVSNGVANP